MEVELVTFTPINSVSGIGRYMRELHAHISQQVPVRLVSTIDPPLTRFLSTLHHFPLGLRGHRPGSVVHFTQIMGCSQMLWHPVRPAVATVHDLGVSVCSEDELLFNRFDRWVLGVQWAGLRRMDRFIAVSDFTKQSLVASFGIPQERVHVVHSGVKGEQFRPVPRSRALVAERYGVLPMPDVHDLLYVGNEQPRKNLKVLLNALVILKAQGHRLRLIKVGGAGGDRWRKRFLDEIRALKVDADVRIVDSVPEADLALFYSAADLYVTPSLLEGFGLPVLEAMACGTPVVCSRAGSLPEVAGDAAILVEARDAEAFSAAITNVLHDDSLRAELKQRGFERAAIFDWRRTAEETLAVYEELSRIGNRRHRVRSGGDE
jgi:glycosyltransferase involved in cell wall biosynthesis